MNRALIFVSIILLYTTAFADGEIHDWDAVGASGLTWSGWTYYDGNPTGADDFGNPGWRDNSGQFWDAGSNWYPRCFQKGDYSGVSTPSFVVDTISPSSGGGSALKIINTGGSDYRPSWWVWADASNFGTLALASTSTDRLDFYIYASGLNDEGSDCTAYNTFFNYNYHVGTYTCEGTECQDQGGDGEGGYSEGWHYYHHPHLSNSIWFHVQLGTVPEHAREGVSDPTSPLTQYFWHIPTIYFEHYSAASGAYYIIDEITLNTTTQSENDSSTGTVGVGYNTATGKWEIFWHDNSFASYSCTPNCIACSTFDIRWSTSPITNANFTSATQIEPEYHEVDTTNLVRRGAPDRKPGWTQFDLPYGTESTYNHLYFAIKDVSSTGSHAGSFPYNAGDGHDAPTSNIRTIDYVLEVAQATPTPTLSGIAGRSGVTLK